VSILQQHPVRAIATLQASHAILVGCVGALTALLVSSVAYHGEAHADANGGTVTGAVELPPRIDRKEMPAKNRGFLKRMKGPLQEPRGADQRPDMIVVLVGGPVASDDAKPPRLTARYRLIGESFETNVFGYVAGATVEVHNDSEDKSPLLYSPTSEDAIEKGPVSPGGKRPIKAPTTAFESLEIRDRESAHLSGTIVAMPHPYFSLISRNGSYTIKGVPAGKWTVKIWYDGGWLDMPGNPSVTVAAKKPAKAPSIKLPVEPSSKPAASSAAPEAPGGSK